MERLNQILLILNRENAEFDDSFPIALSVILEEDELSEASFLRRARRLTGRVRIRGNVSKKELLRLVYEGAKSLDSAANCYVSAKRFLEKYLQPGEAANNDRARENVIRGFPSRSPHGKLVTAFSRMLQKIALSHQLMLHGVKEYSGVDLVKKLGSCEIGFQIKSVNDLIDEPHIRAQHSKAREWKLDGYVLVLARPPHSKVDDAIQVAKHLFSNENKRKEMHCVLITPGQLAELLITYRVRLNP